MKLKPKPYSMSSTGHEITYKCANCGFKFNMANRDCHYCPKCSVEIDWGVITTANEEYRQLFLSVLDDTKKRYALLSALDMCNATITDGFRRAMEQTEDTKKAIVMSNIDYYLGIGWTKEELINKNFFTKKDFEEYER